MSVDKPGASLVSGTAAAITMITLNPHLKQPEAWNWNFTYERQMFWKSVFSAAYVAHRGLHAWQVYDINQAQPGALQANPGVNINLWRAIYSFLSASRSRFAKNLGVVVSKITPLRMLFWGARCSTLGAGGCPTVLISRNTSLQSVPANLTNLANWQIASQAAESKKALDIRVLDLREVTSFTDFFVICSATNPRQSQAISDEIGKRLAETGELPVSIEGYSTAEWILMDYGDFIVHIFSAAARSYYDLERLWRHGKEIDYRTSPG